MINYSDILTLNYPNTQWALYGVEYSGLEWYDPTPKPTQEELDALWIATQEADSKAANKVVAQAYLVSTDYMMTADYDKDTTEVRVLRANARSVIRGLL